MLSNLTEPAIARARPLSLEDRGQILSVFASQNTVLKAARDEAFTEHFNGFLDRNLAKTPADIGKSDYRLIGSFLDGKLIAMVGQLYWKTMPLWTVCNLYVHRDRAKALNLIKTGLGPCMDMAAAMAEADERFSFYWVTDTAHWNVRERLWSQGTSTFKRYIILTETVVEPNSRPPYDYQWGIMGSRYWPRKVALKQAQLKKGYRHQHFLRKGLVDEEFVDLQGNGF